MKNIKTNGIIGFIAICINAFLLINSFYFYYCYNFTDILFLFMYPNHILLMNALVGALGICVSILLYKRLIGINLFLIVTLALWLLTLSNYFFPIF